ncbi:SGNH/GDSL hydrolase family protein [Azospirillum sp. ST 5-10]|uniref:SGNH/GDSL hydrolase family protein n=1 Tax=unclassified Azospirillum TaxID=2630922 RepID=UPI003F4A1C56
MIGRVLGGVLAIALLWAGGATASELCPLPPESGRPVAADLPRTRDALAAGRPLTVVALGSSSTEGVGASAPSKTYPAQLEALLGQRLKAARIAVLNKGVGGETAGANLARFDRDVLAAKPDLVVWQVGTNDSFQRVPLPAFVAAVRDGAALARDAGADLILMNPQYFPGERDVDSYAAYVDAVQALGRELGVPVVDRHSVMKWWLDSGRFTADAILSPDGYHMRDPSYRCLAEFVADVIATPDRAQTAAVR